MPVLALNNSRSDWPMLISAYNLGFAGSACHIKFREKHLTVYGLRSFQGSLPIAFLSWARCHPKRGWYVLTYRICSQKNESDQFMA